MAAARSPVAAKMQNQQQISQQNHAGSRCVLSLQHSKVQLEAQ